MHTLEEINLKTKSAYNKAAEKYYEMFFDELDTKEFDKNFLDDFSKYFNSGSIVCDAGCGPCGHVADYISKKGIKIIGIDISEKCIEIANKSHPGIQFETGDFSNLRFNDSYFDGIISYYSIVDTPKKYIKCILKEFQRILKDKGYLLLVVKEGNSEGLQNDLLGLEAEIYFSLFTKEEIEKFLSGNGFEIIRLEERTPYKDEIDINRIYSISKKIS
jgi:ubiquinone/menaquinone biosynthesis C-methylase UbiE